MTAPFVSDGHLAVLGKRDVERSGVLEGVTHQLRVLHAVAVVGEQPYPGGRQLAERRQRGALAIHW